MAKSKKVRELTRRKCKKCGETFTVFRKWAEFCSPKCRVAYWQEQNPRIPAAELEKLRHEPESH
jgi:hypothetical protein